jgi:hypothetical protein
MHRIWSQINLPACQDQAIVRVAYRSRRKLFDPMTVTEQLTLIPTSEKWKPVRDDFNFCRLALFVSSDKKADRFRDIEQRYSVDVNGNTFEAIWEVRHDSKLGLPGTFDRDVWLGIMEIVQEQTESGRKPVPEIIELGSLRDFLRRIGKNSGGKYTGKLKESIKRLTRTTCFTEKSYNCPSSGGYLQLLKPLHLIEECAFRGEKTSAGEVTHSTWIKLGDYVRRNLESGYIALLDVHYIRGLAGEFSKQLVPFLSYRFWLASQRGRDFISVSWEELATYLAACGWENLARAKQRLDHPVRELIEQKYIAASSQWHGDKFIFLMGDKFIDELQDRLQAKEHYKAWLTGKHSSKQLSFLPQPVEVRKPISADDQRQAILVRQAIRVGILHQQPDTAQLVAHGWAVEDVLSLARTMSRKTTR